ncbi:transmembrane protease serine 5 [Rhinatrema bivittatum]|uniref:transmembrane protease serine 5 n=1 Tax=Rhinatrema bivittatum TaxID=194408 RepID=UPI00112948C2|nr:transmembrane protease serine 5 [Rhinatrema bivittatum]
MSLGSIVQPGLAARHHAEGRSGFENDREGSVTKRELRNAKASSESHVTKAFFDAFRTFKKCLVIIAAVGLLAGTAVGTWILVENFVKPFAHQDPAMVQDTETTVSCSDTGSGVTTRTPSKVSFRINTENFLLEVQVENRPSWLLVCHDGWMPSLGTAICRQLGHASLTHHKGVNTTDIRLNHQQGFVQLVSSRDSSADHLWQLRSTCDSGRIVALKCSDCGSRTKAPQLAGGSDSGQGRWPWLVGLYLHSKRICGGSIVTAQWVITAAHCVHKSPSVSSWLVFEGIASTERQPGSALEKIIYHPNFNERSHDYDIAVMKLKSPLRFSDSRQAVCLPPYKENLRGGMQCWITGWGHMKAHNAQVPETLRETAVPLMSTKKCNGSYLYDGKITPRMLCAGYLDGKVDAGKGDSGGPLMCQKEHAWHLVGMVSWDNRCAEPHHPGVYTKVSAFLDWIYHVIDNN